MCLIVHYLYTISLPGSIYNNVTAILFQWISDAQTIKTHSEKAQHKGETSQ
jgi:hypothetical protein